MADRYFRTRAYHGPLGADVYRRKPLRNQNDRVSTPAPLLERKHVANPPIVTIFGAGVAGLTAAHELVDRGFLVQVVEKARDAYAKGRPLVGGMASSQYTRVRANITDLHGPLLDTNLRPEFGPAREWLLHLFTYNRGWWLQTEAPATFLGALYSQPDETIFASAVESLSRAREQYRARWIWDLILRSFYIGTISSDAPEDKTVELARRVHDELAAQQDAYGLVAEILKILRGESAIKGAKLPIVGHDLRLEQLENARDLVSAAIEREFLAFRLVPFARDLSPRYTEQAIALHSAWTTMLASHFKNNLISQGHPRVRVASAPSMLPDDKDAWLELDIIEQRLPGEHGYRFFPSYYRHLDDTMRRIPLFDGDRHTFRTAADNLVPVLTQAIGLSEGDRKSARPDGYTVLSKSQIESLDPSQRQEHEPVEIGRDRPTSFDGLRDRTERFLRRLGCEQQDGLLFGARLLRFMTSGANRRRTEYERLDWAQFIGIDDPPPPLVDELKLKLRKLPYSPAMSFHIKAAAQTLLALSAAEADARTYGDAVVQLLMDMLKDGSRVDRTLNGPTSDVWLEPWREYLERRGVQFFLGELTSLERDPQNEDELKPNVTLTRPTSQDGYPFLAYTGNPLASSAPDFYVLALDVETTSKLLDGVGVADSREAPDFAAFKAFYSMIKSEGSGRSALKDMTGIQFFFDSKTSIGKGHIYFPYSEWGLSSISQSEFWSPRGGFADGFLSVLSVDICQTDPEHGPRVEDVLRSAFDAGRTDGLSLGRWLVARETWGQIKNRIASTDSVPDPRAFNLDRNITLDEHGKYYNATPYLATLPGTWRSRAGLAADAPPDKEIKYNLNFKRWVLCGTHMATRTRLTTMEAANESARHAVVAILKRLEKRDAEPQRAVTLGGLSIMIDSGYNETFNAASARRRFDLPDVYDPESNELEDLKIFKRLDDRLFKLGLPHWMDICDFDRRLRVMLDVAEIAGSALADDVVKLVIASLETALKDALGDSFEFEPAIRRITKIFDSFKIT